MLRVSEVADYLHVSRSTIFRLLKRTELPAFKVGSDWRFDGVGNGEIRTACFSTEDTLATRLGQYRRRHERLSPVMMVRTDRGIAPYGDKRAPIQYRSALLNLDKRT